ncbi:hypothetical protein [Methylobacterium sp. J-070]|uniref:hypothetical protein n=1 Tax=Methylobacterium sp. J-070 TaxID=2836650 RepID=UPI001FB94357|nr:hypothetical protein [Methylobacterium sp. J-070]MCJ2048974.1 hypothetical protein [Methylobacterium sp. J-070]
MSDVGRLDIRSRARASDHMRERLETRIAVGCAAAILTVARAPGWKIARKLLSTLLSVLPAGLTAKIATALSRELSRQFKAGLSAAGLERLAFAYSLFQQDAEIASLILRLNLYPETSNEVVEYVLSHATQAVRSRPDVKLMELFYHAKTGSASFTLARFRELSFSAIRHDPVLTDIWRICSVKCIVEMPTYYATFDLEAFINYIGIESDPNVLYSVLYALSNQHALSVPLSEVADALTRVQFSASAECFAITYFFLISFGFDRQAAELERAQGSMPRAMQHPMYLKGRMAPQNVSADTYRNQDFEPEKLSGDHLNWIWRDAQLQNLEIESRFRRRLVQEVAPINLNRRRRHLFVAFFGQMRFADKTLSAIRDWILQDFTTHCGDLKITFGLSTWQRTGAKTFLLTDHIDVIAGFLPAEVLRALKDFGCCTIEDAASLCPRSVRQIIGGNNVRTEIDLSSLQAMLSSKLYSIVATDEEFMAALGNDISNSCEADPHLLNQGRMITRIGAVGDMLNQVDREQGEATHVLFIRPDLCDLQGSLASVYQQLSDQTNWAAVDEDFYAQVVEGVGDRYILCDRRAAEVVVGILDKTRSIFDGSLAGHDLYKRRLYPHRMLRTVLFEGGVKTFTVSRWVVGWNIFRGSLNAETIRPSLIADAQELGDPRLKDKILAAITPAAVM